MPSHPHGANVATAAAVFLAILLAVVWLRSSGDPPLAVPAPLPAEAPLTVPTPDRVPAASAVLRQGGGGDRTGRVGGGKRPGGAVEGSRADERRAQGRGRRAGERQDPPAVRPGPGGSGASAPQPPAAPEFAIG